MIENLLDLSRLNAGALPPAADWLDPRELVEAAVAELFRGEPQTRVRVAVAAGRAAGARRRARSFSASS